MKLSIVKVILMASVSYSQVFGAMIHVCKSDRGIVPAEGSLTNHVTTKGVIPPEVEGPEWTCSKCQESSFNCVCPPPSPPHQK
ncbi:uncharacterized protein MELLADRAFT_124512 [Melampsora larici-populina 98AG31]|uniref:Secreted protein n=1 Tax=Melampsora larici-populina (strain 98AG31 / pathotype 3-4-7) TaxID=747676 RepID=F4S2V7_MELLP|nr:uncharacterized protein MELLADRAFT_124512 [Melampsora larici-populina 98AG31]EGG01123.1 secreted protein [Melampsora larici-populina 98AG31]